MKFANYSFNARGVNNLGDNMQIIAIEQIYETMGIAQNDVVYIDTNKLSTYDGEYVVLPVTMPLVDFRPHGIAGRFSDRIIPMFLGFTMVKDTLLPEETAYLNRMTPIGCRDERTLQTMRRYGIESYLHGCITATLPLRDLDAKYDSVYIVDAPSGLEQYIPNYILKKSIRKTHLHSGLTEDPKHLMQKYYDEYKANASLVITSLLHCAVPCIAAGIPVILAKSGTGISYRFSWLEKLTDIYLEQDFKNIDWNPKPILYEKHKKDLLDLTIKRLKKAYDRYSDTLDLSLFYESRDPKPYINDACQSLIRYIGDHWTDKMGDYQYAVWGLTQIAEYLISFIDSNYPNAKLCHVYDAFRQEELGGLMSMNPEAISKYPDETVFVCTNGAAKAAEKIQEECSNKDIKFAFMEPVK